jgi:hypothetical protein
MADMAKLSILVMTLLLAMTAAAQERRPISRYDEYMKILEMERRVHELRPRRRDEPLRELNISDDEVREVQLVAGTLLPKVLLNISPVVGNCPCEEGPRCTAQVYILAESARGARGLQLSRIDNAWVVGSVQQWWLRFEELHSRANKTDIERFMSERNAMLREFPRCVGQLVPAENTTAAVPKVESGK